MTQPADFMAGMGILGKGFRDQQAALERRKEILLRIEDCEEGDVNEWEVDFLTSLKEQVLKGVSFTQAQLGKLAEIEYKQEIGPDAYYRELRNNF